MPTQGDPSNRMFVASGKKARPAKILDQAIVDGGLEGELELPQGALDRQVGQAGSRGQIPFRQASPRPPGAMTQFRGSPRVPGWCRGEVQCHPALVGIASRLPFKGLDLVEGARPQPHPARRPGPVRRRRCPGMGCLAGDRQVAKAVNSLGSHVQVQLVDMLNDHLGLGTCDPPRC